jgi:predicted RNA-binding protein with EMAP domain
MWHQDCHSQITYLTFLLNTKTNLDHDVEDEAVLVVILMCEVQLYQYEPMEKLYVVFIVSKCKMGWN